MIIKGCKHKKNANIKNRIKIMLLTNSNDISKNKST